MTCGGGFSRSTISNDWSYFQMNNIRRTLSASTLLWSLTLGPAQLCAWQDGATLPHAASMDSTYEAVLNEVKNEGYSIDSASKDAGIKTAMTVAGRYRQTGSHLEIVFLRDGETKTTVRVAVLERKRYKALNTEPWSDPKVNSAKSRDAAAKLKAGLGW